MTRTSLFHRVSGAISAALIIALTVRRQRPHSEPAPHALATFLVVEAPWATTSETVWLVTPLHRHTYIDGAPISRSRRFASCGGISRRTAADTPPFRRSPSTRPPNP